MVTEVDQATVSLLRWLRRQLRQPTPLREHLEAAVANDDPAEARRLLARFDFTDAQRRHVEGLIDRWERSRSGALRTRRSSAGSSTPSRASRDSRCAGCSRDDATWIVPGDGVMAGTFRGREEIFRFLGRLPKETDGTLRVAADRRARLRRPRGGALPRLG